MWISKGNAAARENNFETAIKCYLRALDETPQLSKLIKGNLDRTRSKFMKRSINARMQVAICTWDITSESAVRSYALAQMYGTFSEATIVGPLFKKKRGKDIWPPIKNAGVATRTFSVDEEEDYILEAFSFVSENPYDLVHLCQLRPSNLFLGILYWLIWGSRVLLDIDDKGDAFIERLGQVSVDEYLKEHMHYPVFSDLDSDDWIRLCNSTINHFEGISVTDSSLMKKFKSQTMLVPNIQTDLEDVPSTNETPRISKLLVDNDIKALQRLVNSVFRVPAPQLGKPLSRFIDVTGFLPLLVLSNSWCYQISEPELHRRVKQYNAQRASREAKVVVYMAIIGGYDQLILPESIVDEWDYVLFSDCDIPGEHIFEIRRPDYVEQDPTRVARYIKTHPHIYFPNHDYSIWIDSNILVRGTHLLRTVRDFIDGEKLFMSNPHPDRKCTYQELVACASNNKDDVQTMERQVNGYRAEGFPENFGLFETNVLIRCHNNSVVKEFDELWWNEINRNSRRDQLSVMYLIWKTGLRCEILPEVKDFRIHLDNEYCLFPHGLMSNRKLPGYIVPHFVKVATGLSKSYIAEQDKTTKTDLDVPVIVHKTPRQTDESLLQLRMREYRSASRDAKKKVVVYTAISNNYDVLKIPEHLPPEWDFVCFSDRQHYPGDHIWQVRHFDYINSATPTLTARYVKTHPHVYFDQYECSVWIDAHLLIKTDFLEKFVSSFMRGDGLLSAIPHPFRSCTYSEGDICLVQAKDDQTVILGQMQRYRTEGLPTEMGLIETGLLVRRHNDVKMREANKDWWKEIERGSKRDQLSIMYVLWKCGINYLPMMDRGTSTRNHDGFQFFQHGLKETARDARYVIPSFLPTAYTMDRSAFWANRPQFDRSTLDQYMATPVDIVICVHNALDDVVNCLESVSKAMLPAHNVIIIDDGCDMPTRVYLGEVASRHSFIKMIRHESAKGYTISANEGIKASSAPFIILLNSDTIVSPGWVLKLLHAAESAKDIGIVGPMSNAASWQSVPRLKDPTTRRMALNELAPGMTAAETDQLCERFGWFGVFPRVPLVNGFCYGIKRELIEAIGLFDAEAFPKGYGEEDDFSMRAADAGFVGAIATHCYVFHAKSKSFGSTTRQVLAEAGGRVLRMRHGEERIRRAVQFMELNPLFHVIRKNFETLHGIETYDKRDPGSLGLPDGIDTQANEVYATKTLSAPGTQNSRGSDRASQSAKMNVEKYTFDQLSEKDPTIFPKELKLAKISLKEIEENARFVRQMKESGPIGVPTTALWILPNFRNILAGGIRTLFMVAENLTKTMGVQNTFALLNTSDAVILQDTARIQALFPDLNFGIKHIAVEDDLSQLPAADIAICSSWPTAYILAKFNRCTAKFYFMQDYETLFYPAGSLSGMIDQTYRFGFYCITNSPGIYNKYLNFSKNAEYFIPGVDAAIFNSHKAERRIGPPWQVVHYGRPRNQRNAFALGLEALREVKAHFGDAVRILSAGAVWNPKMYGFEGVIENLGILDDINAVADLYRSSHAGVVSMLTPHPSYQPLEYMACGCATVTNENDGTKWLFKDHENAIVTSIVPSDIARGVITVLEDEALWKRIVDGGAKTAASLNWEDAFSKIRNYIVAPNENI